MRVSDDGRAIFAESKINFTEGIFQMIKFELPGSCWGDLSDKKKYRESIPAVLDVKVAISCAISFWSLKNLDAKFCAVLGGASRVLGKKWK